MKTNSTRNSVLGLIVASTALALPWVMQAQSAPAPAPTPAQPAAPTTNVSGKVEARTAHSLTIGGRTISLTSATTCSKANAMIGSADVKVGDKVNVVTPNDGQVAVSVSVAE